MVQMDSNGFKWIQLWQGKTFLAKPPSLGGKDGRGY